MPASPRADSVHRLADSRQDATGFKDKGSYWWMRRLGECNACALIAVDASKAVKVLSRRDMGGERVHCVGADGDCQGVGWGGWGEGKGVGGVQMKDELYT